MADGCFADSPPGADAGPSQPDDLPLKPVDAPQEPGDSLPEASPEPEGEEAPPEEENADDAGHPQQARDPFASIERRQTKSRTSPVGPSYCHAPPQADALCRARSTTSQTFERSQRPPVVFNPREIYWRDRYAIDRDRKRNFEHAILARSQRRFGVHSPYLYDLGRHREAVHAAFEKEVEERETHDMRSRHAAMMRYRSAVQHAWEHDDRLPKSDRFHKIQASLRILVLNTR